MGFSATGGTGPAEESGDGREETKERDRVFGASRGKGSVSRAWKTPEDTRRREKMTGDVLRAEEREREKEREREEKREEKEEREEKERGEKERKACLGMRRSLNGRVARNASLASSFEGQQAPCLFRFARSLSSCSSCRSLLSLAASLSAGPVCLCLRTPRGASPFPRHETVRQDAREDKQAAGEGGRRDSEAGRGSEERGSA